MKYIYLVILSLLLFSCKNDDQQEDNIVSIKVDVKDTRTRGNFDDFFSSYSIIPLETNQESLMGKISRISILDSCFYILDRSTNSVLVFNNKGKFLRKIQRLGKGEGEYLQLTDFALDEKNKRIVLYSDRPYKILFYTLEGDFLSEKREDDLYNGIAVDDGELLLLNRYEDQKHMLLSRDMNSGKIQKFKSFNRRDVMFKNMGTFFPYLLKDKNVHLFFPYSDTIYQFNDKKELVPEYHIDFGNKKAPERLFDEKEDAVEIYQKAIDKYGFGISNFKENKDYVYFTYGTNAIVIYSKRRKVAATFNFITHDHVFFGNYFAHDGDDNQLISIYPALAFRQQMNTYKKDSIVWEDISENIRQLYTSTTPMSNPLLVIYKLKDDI